MLASWRTALPASRDGGDDGHLVPVLERRLAAGQEADVLLVHVDVDEAAELPRLLDEPLPEPRELALEVLDQLGHVLALGHDLARSAGDPAEGGGNANHDWHRCLSSRPSRAARPPAAGSASARALRPR